MFRFLKKLQLKNVKRKTKNNIKKSIEQIYSLTANDEEYDTYLDILKSEIIVLIDKNKVSKVKEIDDRYLTDEQTNTSFIKQS